MALVTFWQIKAFGTGDMGDGSVKEGEGQVRQVSGSGSDSSVLM